MPANAISSDFRVRITIHIFGKSACRQQVPNVLHLRGPSPALNGMLRSAWINAAAMRHHGKLAVPATSVNAARVSRRVSEVLARQAVQLPPWMHSTVHSKHVKTFAR